MINKTIFVSGSSKGIGKGINDYFANLGWNHFITARNINSDVLKSHNTNTLDIKSVDFGDVKQVKNYSDELLQKNIKIDILVINAGTGQGEKGLNSSFKNNLASFKKNFIPTFNTLSFIGGKMMNKNSLIVLIGSIASMTNVNAPLIYSEVKYSFSALAKSFALSNLENERNIKVAVIHLGHMNSPGGIWDLNSVNSDQVKIETNLRKIPDKQFGSAIDVAELILRMYDTKYFRYLEIAQDGGLSVFEKYAFAEK